MEAKLDLQPTLLGDLLELRPLNEGDFEELYSVASDPLLWEQHHAKGRHERGVFEKLFDTFKQSGSTLVAIDRATRKIIGSSQYYEYSETRSEVVIGFTMLSRKYWGGIYNGEMKRLMLDHAFNIVDRVLFHVGEQNIRSQKAVEKIGGKFIKKAERTWSDGRTGVSLFYEITRSDFNR